MKLTNHINRNQQEGGGAYVVILAYHFPKYSFPPIFHFHHFHPFHPVETKSQQYKKGPQVTIIKLYLQ